MLRDAALIAVLLTGALSAQSDPGGTGSSTFYFSTDFAELANSGVGTTVSTPGNQAATFDDEEILMVAPDLANPYFALSCFSFAATAAWFGDNDGDGDYNDDIINDVDALYLPLNAPNPPSVFDFYISWRFFTDSQGVLMSGGQIIEDGDLVRLLPGGGFVPFITEAQIAEAMNSITPSTSIDVNAFTVDESTGDLYWSMHLDQDVGGTIVEDGGVVRLESGNYFANPDGTVQSVTPDSAEIVLFESEVDLFFINAGLLDAFDVTGLEIDPNGGCFVSTSTGLVLPNLWLCDEQAANGPAIVTTDNGFGAIVDRNNIAFCDGPALGLDGTGFSEIATRNLSALAFRDVPLPNDPLMLDVFPTGIVTPTPVELDVGGATPNGLVLILVNFAEGSTIGGFTPRTPIAPIFSIIDKPESYKEVYVDDLTDPNLFALSGFPILIDAQGYGSLTVTVPVDLSFGLAVSCQALDAGTLALSTPVILVSE